MVKKLNVALIVLSILYIVDFFGYILVSIVIWLISILLTYGLRALFYFLNYFIARSATKVKNTHSITFIYLKRKTQIDVEELLKSSKFSKLARFDWVYLKLFFRMFPADEDLYHFFCPYGQRLIQQCLHNDFQRQYLMKFISFYERPLQKIIDQLIKKGKITEKEEERIIYEHTPEQRKYLEEHLPHSHPTIFKITESDQIKIDNNFKILK